MLLNVVAATMTCPLVGLLREPQSTAEGERVVIVITIKYNLLTWTSWLFWCPLPNHSILCTHSHACSSETVTIVTGVGCNTPNSASVDHHLSILRV